MERSPIKDVEIKVLLKAALTDQVTDRDVYMKALMQVTIMKAIPLTKLKHYNNYDSTI